MSALPPGACDSQIHAYDSITPTAPTATSPGPEWATMEAYLPIRDRLGLSRVVVVQPTAYGLDNRCTLEAIARFGLDNARGSAVIDSDVSDAELERLHAGGIRGARFQMFPGGAVGWEHLEPVAARIAALGWHIQLQMDGRQFADREDFIRGLPCRVLIDHTGKFLEPVPVEHPGFQSLLRLLDTGRVWLKLAAPYEVSRTGGPDYADVAVLGRAAASRFPQRMLWASNWPHIGIVNKPDEAALLSTISGWVPVGALQAMLVENPAELYGFPLGRADHPGLQIHSG